jgi:Cell Wall Hydrolase
MRLMLLSSLALLPAVPTAALASGSEAAEPFVASRDEASFDRSLQCLTQAIYYEARSESENGQRAVAQVVLNRVRHPAYPNSVCGVVYQGSERVTGCQFTFTCDGSMSGGIEPYAWERAERIAAAALRGDVYRPVGLATNYHTTAIHPYWAPSLIPQAVVGAHIFYRRPGAGLDSFSQAPSEDEADGAPQARYAVARSEVRQIERPRRMRYEPMALVEIPVVERPLRFRTAAGSAAAPAGRRTAPRAAASRSAPRVAIESGVRVFRGS